ncbi:MAG: enoyl-CoA hydratase-related protein, partial [Xanthobacteraceae bacterium]
MSTDKQANPGGQNVLVEFKDGIAWVTLNRPEKRNAMSPALNNEMMEVLDALEVDDRCSVMVLTGAGESFSAGMDIKEYFREVDKATPIGVMRVQRASMGWQWRRLMFFPKPTIAMINGWCFGGAFTPMVSCDIAIAAEEATFGLSEVNWGIIPAGNVTRAVAEKMA